MHACRLGAAWLGKMRAHGLGAAWPG